MNRSIVVCSFLLGLAGPIYAIQAGLLPERVEKSAEERVASGWAPVIVIGMVDGSDSEIEVFGKLPDGKTPDGNTVFEIGSISKTFTALLLAEEVQSGHLKLDMQIAGLLPDFTFPSRNGKQITLLDLATHYSGLPNMPTNFRGSDWFTGGYSAPQMMGFLASYQLPRDPGSSFEYSNFGFAVLGCALAESARSSYRDLLKAKVLNPLAMTMTDTEFSETTRGHLAPGFDSMSNPARNYESGVFAGAGGIRSTAADMLRYLKANMGVAKTTLNSAMKISQQPRRASYPRNLIGLAWVTRLASSGNIIWHAGQTLGYSSFIGFTADGLHGVVVLTNTVISQEDLGFAALQSDAQLLASHKSIPMAAILLDEYVGTYQLVNDGKLTVSRAKNSLLLKYPGSPVTQILPSGSNEFFGKVPVASYSFRRDEKGAVTGLVVHQNGDNTLPKLSSGDMAERLEGIRLDAVTLQQYVGKFQLTPDFAFDVTRDGEELFVQVTGQPAMPAFARSKDIFLIALDDLEIGFDRDSTGRIVALLLHIDGFPSRAPRIEP